MEDTNKTPASEVTETEATVNEAEAQNTDILKAELEKVNAKKDSGRTELEKALFKKAQLDKQIKMLQGDDQDEIVEDDDAPVTRKELRKLQEKQSVKTATQLADEITNETERELVKYHIENTIRSTGNPVEDLALARTIVNGKKNELLLSEVARKGTAKQASGSSAPAKEEDREIEFTPQELSFMRPPFNLSKEDIIKARK